MNMFGTDYVAFTMLASIAVLVNQSFTVSSSKRWQRQRWNLQIMGAASL